MASASIPSFARIGPIRIVSTFVFAAFVFAGFAAPSFAQTSQFVSLLSGRNGEATGSSTYATDNLTTYKGGAGIGTTTSYSSSLLSVTFYTTYNATTHVLSNSATPTGFSTTPLVGSNGGSDSYTGGPATTIAPNGTLLTAQSITPFASTTANSDSVGYYDYKVSFTFASATTQAYSVFGTTNEDNEVQDVIVNYTPSTGAGTVATLTALNGSEIRTTNNKASNAQFVANKVTNTGGTQTVDIIVYNQSGATNMNFAMNIALPEPSTFVLTGMAGILGLPFLGAVRNRRRK